MLLRREGCNWRRNTQCVDPNMEKAEEENVKLGFVGSFVGAHAKKRCLVVHH